MLHGAFKPKKANAAGFRIVEIGSDKFPINVMEMAPIDSTIWEKKACFDSLSTAMYNHIDNISTPDLITTVSSEIPMDTITAFIEADTFRKGIMENILMLLTSRGWYF